MGHRARGMAMWHRYGTQGMGTEWRVQAHFGVQSVGSGHGAQVQLPGVPPTPTPSPESAEEQPRGASPGRSAPFPMLAAGALCSWHPCATRGGGITPSTAPPPTLPWSQRGLSGSESLLLLLLPPPRESGLLRDGEPASEGGGVSISITSAFTTSTGVSALAPPLQEATRSFRDSVGSRTS